MDHICNNTAPPVTTSEFSNWHRCLLLRHHPLQESRSNRGDSRSSSNSSSTKKKKNNNNNNCRKSAVVACYRFTSMYTDHFTPAAVRHRRASSAKAARRLNKCTTSNITNLTDNKGSSSIVISYVPLATHTSKYPSCRADGTSSITSTGTSPFLKTMKPFLVNLTLWTILCSLMMIGSTLAQVITNNNNNDKKSIEGDPYKKVITLKRSIAVDYGRTVYIDPYTDLRLHVEPNDRCVVTVLETDVLSQRLGKLTPVHFPCMFGLKDVHYTHFGGHSPQDDYIRMQIRYDTQTQTIIIPFILHIHVSFKQLEIIAQNTPISVRSLLDLSQPLSSDNTHFSYDPSHQVCKVTILSPASGLPRYGRIVNDTTALSMIDCEDFLQMGVRYQHMARSKSPRKDYIPLLAELMDHNGTLIKQEYFQKMVRIRSGRKNTAPKINPDSSLVMDVDQFVMTAITLDILSAYDSETPDDQLIFNITGSLANEDGFIVSTDDLELPIHSFHQGDVKDLKIAYKPPSQDSLKKRRIFKIELEILDSDEGKSKPINLTVVVREMNILAPIVTTNTGIQLFEGQSRLLSRDTNLNISDGDNIQDVTLSVIRGSSHGKVLIDGLPKKFFTPKDMDEGRVVYYHDGSDTFSDNIIFRITDGSHKVEFLFPVTIYPQDDEPPVLTVNTGLEIRKNELADITPFVLSASDVDSEDAAIKFITEPPFSNEGHLLFRQYQVPENDDFTNWKYIDGAYERVIREFTQQDIVNGKVFYRHVGPHRSDFVLDKIKFKLVDNGDPPNESDFHEFVFKIFPVDDRPPYQDTRCTLLMNADEKKMTVLKKKFLRYTDDDSDDRRIIYTITVPVHDTNQNTPIGAGKIVLCDDESAEVTAFSQAQINHHKICYKPPKEDLGLVARILQFTFDAEDISGNILTDQIFTIRLKPVNDKPPRVINTGFSVPENGQTVLSTDLLNAEDQDSQDKDIYFFVDVAPKHGVLMRNHETILASQQFSKEDIIKGTVVYKNDGEENDSDRFSLTVTDGVHMIPANVKISIFNIDDQVPKMMKTGGRQEILYTLLKVNEMGTVAITTENLKSSDNDNENKKLTFIITKHPLEGVILTETFTQQDIIDQKVKYQHTSGEIGTDLQRDNFELMLTDNSDHLIVDGNKVEQIRVGVDILPVDNKSPIVTLGNIYTVPESKKNVILTSHLDVHDEDTKEEDVICTVVVKPKYGYLENISPAPGSEKSRVGIPITAFSVHQLRLRNINYVQSVHEGVEERSDSFTFTCSDGVSFSPKFVFPIAILPENDETPEVFLRKFVVPEGMLLTIDLPILNAMDQDEPSDSLVFLIVEQPKHGTLGKQTLAGTISITNFTLADITKDSTILYEHDNSETKTDSIKFILTDGVHNVSKTLQIEILPVDDETPRLSINNGLEIENLGETKIITNKDLKAKDLDSDDETILYFVRLEPRHGYLQRIQNGHTRNLTVGSNFTQYDIDQKRIQYTHTGHEGVRDVVKFDVTDSVNPLIDRYFYINVQGKDEVYPDVINRGIELPENGKVVLTTYLLSGTDINSLDQNLQFIITKPPARGHLENSDNPNVPISKFTQIDLLGNKISYVHTSNDQMKMDSFMFEGTDAYNPVVRTFRISLSDKDNKKPVLMFDVLRVKEGGSRLITPFELKAEDRDTKDALIEFTITQVPVHGNLLHNYSRIVTRFTQSDISNNLISYQHDGTETRTDSFSFTVTDGTHSDFYVFSDTSFSKRHPQTLNIEILAVDNGIPQIFINKGAAYLAPIEDGKMGYILSNKILLSRDRDSQSEELRYYLTVLPKNGYMSHSQHGNTTINSWTQADIDRGYIRYILNPEANATSDSFFFKIVDKGGNILNNQPFHLNWAVISMESDQFTINETEKFLNVTLRRRGYLGETCFITIKVENGTAILGEDIQSRYATQVQFNPGQTEKTWRIQLIDDEKFENQEKFYLQVSDPVMAIIEEPSRAAVILVDAEDESTIFIPEEEYKTPETVGEVMIPIHRTGDISQELMVICYTIPGTAQGSPNDSETSSSDYVTRPNDSRSVVHFDKDETKKFCKISIIDDSLFEENEKFSVSLSQPIGGHLGKPNTTAIVIESDGGDEPVIYFGNTEYYVDEVEKYVDVKVWRIGTDLSRVSSVTVISKGIDPQSAEAGLDYIAVNKILTFEPSATVQTLKVVILDDLGLPKVEGKEEFELILRMPVNAKLGTQRTTLISINDSTSDLPLMQFKETEIVVDENDGSVSATIVRSGDLSHISTVRCYTRQGTALVMMDFDERPNTNASVIRFEPGEREKTCRVKLMGDHIHEQEEEFCLVLGSPFSPTLKQALIGPKNTTHVKLTDLADKPVIKFENNKYSVKEPFEYGELAYVRIPVARYGDLSQTSVVRVHTKDGSAKSGRDYNRVSKELVFSVNVSHQMVEIEVLHDNEKEMREAFTVHLKPDKNFVAEVQKNNKAIVYIEERKKLADVTFPTEPMVVSLRDYDNVDLTNPQPIQGYPCICITACNPKHPEFSKTGILCEKEGINNTLTRFRWRISAPSGVNGVTSELNNVEANTFFTSTKGITLDSIYFGPGSRVQCGARAVNVDGDPGLELLSRTVTVSREEGLCMAQSLNSVGAEPFTAKLRYTGPGDSKYANKVRISIVIPHRDGMFPVVSTRRLSNFELILSPDGTRIGQHRCSNLLDYDEIQTQFGFITNETRNADMTSVMEPYQYNSKLRGDTALRFYRNLNLESCLWKFTAYYDISELVNICGGDITTHGQAQNLKQSYMSLHIPLYISYMFHSPIIPLGWQHFDMVYRLRLIFVYDTASLWQNGFGDSEDASFRGYIYPTSIKIKNDGRLMVDFKSEARFHGQFVPEHKGSRHKSLVVTPEHPDLIFTLELINTEPTYEQPEQTWRFTTDFAVRDYSGQYKIKLVPCTTPLDEEFALPLVCDPRDPITFSMPIRLKQVSDPVPAKFSLNTEFYLLKKRELWLSDGPLLFDEVSNVAFIEGDLIYGRINIDPVQSLQDSFSLNIDKVFICSGKDGYIPKYDPDNQEYGCVVDSPNLHDVFKILDKGATHTADKLFHNISFNATLASEDPTAYKLTEMHGTDGFSLSSKPLFQVDAGRQWYIHSIYTIISKENTHHGIGKRSVDYHSLSFVPQQELHNRQRRSINDVEDIGKEGKGTNMVLVQLDHKSKAPERGTNKTVQSFPLIPILVATAVVILLFVIAVIAFLHQRKKTSTPPPSPANTFTSPSGKTHIVYANPNSKFDPDKTEV